MPKQSAEFITGTTESDVDGRMINMNSELVASSLSRTLGGGFRSALSPHWNFNPNRGDGIVPLNHILKFNTFGHPCPIRTTLRQDYQIRLVATRNDDGTLQRGHLVMTCDLSKKGDDSECVARSEFWLALTRLFAPRGEHRPQEVPEEISFLEENKPSENDLISRDIESYRCDANEGMLTHDTQMVAFHLDQSDQYHHINTNVYMSRALDLLALQCSKAGGEVGRLRFREITIYFRKPFMPGETAEVDLDFAVFEDRFHGAVRFYHSSNGTRSERISMAMETRGPLA